MSHLRDVIHLKLKHTVGVLVADKQPCIGMNKAIPAAKRASHRCTPSTLDPAWFRGTYAMAVLLCPGDGTAGLARFAKSHGLNPDWIHFYYAPGTDYAEALAAWRGAGFHVHSVIDVANWGDVNQHFADHWNRIMHDDLCDRAGCVLHVIE